MLDKFHEINILEVYNFVHSQPFTNQLLNEFLGGFEQIFQLIPLYFIVYHQSTSKIKFNTFN